MPRQSSRKPSGRTTPQKPTTNKATDALDQLKADHDTVKALFQRHGSASPEEQTSLAQHIFRELEVHTTIEEELFYPALQKKGTLKEFDELDANDQGGLDAESIAEDAEHQDDEDTLDLEQDAEEEGEDLITLALEDHQAAKELVQELKDLDPKSDQYRDRFLELKEAINDHMEEEEEVLFAEARLNVDTQKLGAELVKRRSNLTSSRAA
jgi:hemerythrin superfamily protein